MRPPNINSNVYINSLIHALLWSLVDYHFMLFLYDQEDILAYCCHKKESMNFQPLFFPIKTNEKRNARVLREINKLIKHCHALLVCARTLYSRTHSLLLKVARCVWPCIGQLVCNGCLLYAFVTEWAMCDQLCSYERNAEAARLNKPLLFRFHNLEPVPTDLMIWNEHPYYLPIPKIWIDEIPKIWSLR